MYVTYLYNCRKIIANLNEILSRVRTTKKIIIYYKKHHHGIINQLINDDIQCIIYILYIPYSIDT